MAIAVADIKDYDSLSEWLQSSSMAGAQLLAFRSSLRSLPFISRATLPGLPTFARKARKQSFTDSVLLPFFRAHAISRVASTWPASVLVLRKTKGVALDAAAPNVRDAYARAAQSAAVEVVNAVTLRGSRHAIDTVGRAIALAAGASRASSVERTIMENVEDKEYRDVGTSAHAEIYSALRHDAQSFLDGEASEILAMSPLWPSNKPDWFESEWRELSQIMRKVGDGWEVWIKWYQDIIDGKRADEEIQREITLIPDKTWKNSARVLNAEVARILGETDTQSEFDDEATDPSTVSLPDRELTPVSFAFDGELIDAEKPDTPQSSADREALAQRGWSALKILMEDVIEFGGGQQNPLLARILNRCLSAMGPAYDDLDVIALGLCQARLNRIAARAHEEMLDDAADDLKELNKQIILFLQQFSDWERYLEGLAQPLGGQSDEVDALPHLSEVVDALRGIQSELAHDRLATLREDATPESSLENQNPIPDEIPRRSFLRAGRDLLLTVFGALLSPLGAGMKEGTKQIVAAAVIGAAAGPISALAQALPPFFSWAKPILEHIVKTFAK